MDYDLLAGRSPRGPFSLMVRVYKYILPGVKEALGGWRKIAEAIPDPELRKQALDSMTAKEFHCIGGAVYAAANLERRDVLIPLIVALQTISDYLDNLCDRSTSLDPDDFRLLHQSMLDAVTPGAPIANYYALRAEQDDGGYLGLLVRRCQTCAARLPSYAQVQPYVRELVSLYGDLQVYKHISHDRRERELLAWWETHAHAYPGLMWNEFAAATGSTLGMFMLFLAASDESLPAKIGKEIRESYFPSINGLHILLDYLIDQAEDAVGGDLNFCSYYDSQEELDDRLQRMVGAARSSADRLPFSRFHRMIVEGLVALYLSDPKVKGQQSVRRTARLLMKGSPWTRVFFWLNSHLIRKAM
ncbi:tetraprenyl-beta-curcumene synthase family protein [Cohnella nanjingensis]|uniref:Tetraprenyl-beta-curcumene synthase family protein n=1 Tax=Cohnella nanjingensis TaxID=1387779 RepID=A0A7X0VHM4_9BACL|nr:tetraprenyl-beta-curcumene synthase family protein [Cohnella nanjingensis]MBB6674302.1 tetraprenyl-beta-curcumene synthase family protein [Cohnella nanjingensis]